MNRVFACLGDPSVGLAGLILVIALALTSTEAPDASTSSTHDDTCISGVYCVRKPPPSGLDGSRGATPRTHPEVTLDAAPATASAPFILRPMPTVAHSATGHTLIAD